jgi:ComF family protein
MGCAMLKQVGSAFEAFADVLFPSLCYVCGELLPEGSRVICPSCVSAIPTVEISDPLRALARERLCGDDVVNDVVSLFHFEKGGPLQGLLHQLKYGGASGLGVWFGEQIGAAIRRQGGCCQYDAIIPVPLHAVKRRERGYNQSERIAKGMSRVLNLPVETGIVKRIRHTQTQTALGIDARRTNMEGAFEVRRKRSSRADRKNFLLVDDVITTGATIRSCASALREAGAQKIIACSAALAERVNL